MVKPYKSIGHNVKNEILLGQVYLLIYIYMDVIK